MLLCGDNRFSFFFKFFISDNEYFPVSISLGSMYAPALKIITITTTIIFIYFFLFYFVLNSYLFFLFTPVSIPRIQHCSWRNHSITSPKREIFYSYSYCRWWAGWAIQFPIEDLGQLMRLLLPDGIGDRHCFPCPNSARLSSVNETETRDSEKENIIIQ